MLFRLQTKHASFLSRSCPYCHTAAESQALSASVCVGRPRLLLLHERGQNALAKKGQSVKPDSRINLRRPKIPRGALMAHE